MQGRIYLYIGSANRMVFNNDLVGARKRTVSVYSAMIAKVSMVSIIHTKWRGNPETGTPAARQSAGMRSLPTSLLESAGLQQCIRFFAYTIASPLSPQSSRFQASFLRVPSCH